VAEDCRWQDILSDRAFLSDRQGCIPAPPALAIAYSCAAMVLNPIVGHGFPLSRE
jgi:hypothetical protein